MKIIEYNEQYRNQMFQMIALAQIDAGLKEPCFTPDLINVQKYFFDIGGKFWLAFDEEGSILATIGYKPIPETSEAILSKLYVKYDEKRKGIGGAMLRFAEQYVYAHGITRVHGVLAKQYSKFHGFYPKNGYTFDGVLSIVKDLN